MSTLLPFCLFSPFHRCRTPSHYHEFIFISLHRHVISGASAYRLKLSGFCRRYRWVDCSGSHTHMSGLSNSTRLRHFLGLMLRWAHDEGSEVWDLWVQPWYSERFLWEDASNSDDQRRVSHKGERLCLPEDSSYVLCMISAKSICMLCYDERYESETKFEELSLGISPFRVLESHITLRIVCKLLHNAFGTLRTSAYSPRDDRTLRLLPTPSLLNTSSMRAAIPVGDFVAHFDPSSHCRM